MYYFTADEHHGHFNAIKYCNRPFDSIVDMTEKIIENHNSIVTKDDTVIHLGDFSLYKTLASVYTIINRLNGKNIFLKGSHDYWMNKGNGKSYFHEIWEKKIDDKYVVCCHYAMKTWARSHYNSFNLCGHSHGNLKTEGKQYDVGVDCNDFKPVSFDQIKEIMSNKPDNFNLIRKNTG